MLLCSCDQRLVGCQSHQKAVMAQSGLSSQGAVMPEISLKNLVSLAQPVAEGKGKEKRYRKTPRTQKDRSRKTRGTERDLEDV